MSAGLGKADRAALLALALREGHGIDAALRLARDCAAFVEQGDAEAPALLSAMGEAPGAPAEGIAEVPAPAPERAEGAKPPPAPVRKKPAARPWTAEEDAELRRRFNAGDGLMAIARDLGRTASATQFRAYNRLGLKRGRGSVVAPPPLAEAVTAPAPQPAPMQTPAPAASTPPAAPKATIRACLRCGHDFASDGAHNRVCVHCKGTRSWREGDLGAEGDTGGAVGAARRGA